MSSCFHRSAETFVQWFFSTEWRELHGILLKSPLPNKTGLEQPAKLWIIRILIRIQLKLFSQRHLLAWLRRWPDSEQPFNNLHVFKFQSERNKSNLGNDCPDSLMKVCVFCSDLVWFAEVPLCLGKPCVIIVVIVPCLALHISQQAPLAL